MGNLDGGLVNGRSLSPGAQPGSTTGHPSAGKASRSASRYANVTEDRGPSEASKSGDTEPAEENGEQDVSAGDHRSAGDDQTEEPSLGDAGEVNAAADHDVSQPKGAAVGSVGSGQTMPHLDVINGAFAPHEAGDAEPDGMQGRSADSRNASVLQMKTPRMGPPASLANTNSRSYYFAAFKRIFPNVAKSFPDNANALFPKFSQLQWLKMIFEFGQHKKIPLGLFTSSKAGGTATPAEKIMISAQILAQGRHWTKKKIQHWGKQYLDDRVKGQNCGKWVELVWAYAGVSNRYNAPGTGGQRSGVYLGKQTDKLARTSNHAAKYRSELGGTLKKLGRSMPRGPKVAKMLALAKLVERAEGLCKAVGRARHTARYVQNLWGIGRLIGMVTTARDQAKALGKPAQSIASALGALLPELKAMRATYKSIGRGRIRKKRALAKPVAAVLSKLKSSAAAVRDALKQRHAQALEPARKEAVKTVEKQVQTTELNLLFVHDPTMRPTRKQRAEKAQHGKKLRKLKKTLKTLKNFPRAWRRREFLKTDEVLKGKIKPGDWLTLYYSNKSKLGDHSVIFIKWTSGIKHVTVKGKVYTYRESLCASQRRNTFSKAGGDLHRVKIGYPHLKSKWITPVTAIIRPTKPRPKRRGP